ncbi:hypothetical protein DL96DRAFT_1238404 [Flagelloscypha sp. PMI_526]|nr:hypothetical protein DL96DRAFT_1238404 [Flagelloscypha sp. PMI_526]
MPSIFDKVNAHIAYSFVGRYFRLEGSGHPKERVGSRFLVRPVPTTIASFLTAFRPKFELVLLPGQPWPTLSPSMLLSFQIVEELAECPTQDACIADPVYLSCVKYVVSLTLSPSLLTHKPSVMSALTSLQPPAAISSLSSVLMGAFANLPVGMAPGLGLNAYLAYSIVGFHGTGGMITYREALAAVFLEGWLFLILSLLGIRQWIVRLMPQSLVLAVGCRYWLVHCLHWSFP